MIESISNKTGGDILTTFASSEEMSEKIYIIPPNRTRYLSEISENNRQYDRWVDQQCDIARKLFGLKQSIETIENENQIENKEIVLVELKKAYQETELDLDGKCKRILDSWEEKKAAYAADEYIYKVRKREIKVPT